MTRAVANAQTISVAPTPPNAHHLNNAISAVRSNSERWASLPLALKCEYLKNLLSGFHRIAPGLVDAASKAKGMGPDSSLSGEDWLGGPYVMLRHTRMLLETFEQIRRTGGVGIDTSRIRVGTDGRVSVDVFPWTPFDRLLYQGFRAEVRMQPEVTGDNLQHHVGAVYGGTAAQGRVALVLGAGNVASIAPLDVVQKLFIEAATVVLKLNPINEYLAPFWEDAFAELIGDGYLRVVRGDGRVGAYLCHHPQVDEIHVTGSERTHDAIVFGAGEEGHRRKRRNQPILDKPITSELGNVSPVIVVPGRWSRSEIAFQAENIATQMVQNAGFNCNAARVLITSSGWPQREQFLDRLRATLRSLAPRRPYYPGARQRYRQFIDTYADRAEILGRPTEGVLPPALIVGLDPEEDSPLALTSEAFCALCAELPLAESDPANFLSRATAFANDRLHGTLNAEILIDPRTERRQGKALDTALNELRYGTIAVNHWPALGFAFGNTPWGAYPGHTLQDIQSGRGFVHNALLFDKPEKP